METLAEARDASGPAVPAAAAVVPAATLAPLSAAAVADLAGRWLARFEQALDAADGRGLSALFAQECYWRDVVALTWDIGQFHGREAVCARLAAATATATVGARPARLRLQPDRPAPQVIDLLGQSLIEVLFLFDLPHGSGQGLARLAADPRAVCGARCFMLGTELTDLTGVAEHAITRVSRANMQPQAPIHGYRPDYPGQTWTEYLHDKAAFADTDPEVLIFGGGHSAMCIGARFERLGVPYLIVDRHARPGDSWRKRYESLALHTVGAVNHLPYIATPATFPDYVPKDLWADWIESYARLMALNYWSSTEFLGGRFDPAAGRWEVRLRRADGSVRAMRPRHLVMALGGIGSRPHLPTLPGLDSFAGTVLHSSAFRSGRDFRGQRVLVVGMSTSGFDIALDLYRKGATVTMAQRGPTMVVRLEEGVRFNADYLPGKMSVEEADQRRGAGAIYPLLVRLLQGATIDSNRRHAELYAGLERAGVRLTDGPDKTGWLMKLFREFRGYYIDMGCADVIVAGGIEVLQMDRIERFVPEGAALRDGTTRGFDAIVLATGFVNQNEEVTALFGAEVARRVGPAAGLDASGEPHGLAKPLGQAQLWQLYGGLNDCRRLSRLLALQIKAQLDGIVPALRRGADGALVAAPSAQGD